MPAMHVRSPPLCDDTVPEISPMKRKRQEVRAEEDKLAPNSAESTSSASTVLLPLRMQLSACLPTSNVFFGAVGSWLKTSSMLRKDDDGGDEQRTIICKSINQMSQIEIYENNMRITVNEMPQGQKKRL
jgi:hypothetical protein